MFPCKVNWCCCYDLKNGTITLGVVGIIASSFFSILTSLQVLLAGNEVHPIEILAITAMVLYGIISYLLVYGTNEKKPAFLLPWIVMNFMTIVGVFIAVVMGLGCFIGFPHLYSSDDKLWLAMMIIILLVILSLNVYFWIAVRSYHQDLRIEVQANSTNPKSEGDNDSAA
ncbi:hypothetical protein ACFFRR_011609 [Megaselia abdita]